MYNKKFYINGTWTQPSAIKYLDVINPANEEVITQICLEIEKDVNDAVSSMKNAFNSFSVTSKEERLEIFENYGSI